MNHKRTIQYFSDEALERGKKLTPLQVIRFIEDFRTLHGDALQREKSVLISIKVPENLLRSFKVMAELRGLRYQTWIKALMRQEVEKEIG